MKVDIEISKNLDGYFFRRYTLFGFNDFDQMEEQMLAIILGWASPIEL